MRKLLFLLASMCSAQILTPISFTPTTVGCTLPSMSGVYAALFADHALCSGACSNGGSVTSVSDISGNGNDYTSTANATYRTGGVNGLPEIDMLGTAYGLLGGAGVPAGSVSVAMVAKLNTTTGKQTVTNNHISTSSFAYYLNYSAGIQQGADSALDTAIGGGTYVADLNYHQTNAIWTDGVSLALRIDRANDATISSAVTVVIPIDQIGRESTTPFQNANYRWWGIVLFTSAINTTVRNNWEAYFLCQTGL